MNGTVRQRGSTWSYRIDLGIENGKRKQKEKGGFESSKDAKTAMKLAIAELIKNGKIKENKKITLQEVFDEFILYEAPITRKYATIVRYQSLYNNHINELGGYIAGEINASMLQSFIAERITKHNLSKDYTKSIYNLLLVLWNYMHGKEYIINNIIKNVKPPKEYRSMDDIKTYTIEEIKLIWERINNTKNATAFMLAFKLGLRCGEIYALRWSDISFENNTVNICKQLQCQNKKWCFTTLKTPNSYRKIKLDEKLKEYLLSLKDQQLQDKEFFEDVYKTNKLIDKSGKEELVIDVDDLINVKNDGEMLNTNSPKVISRICKSDLNIEFKMHNLRHTHATMLLEKGLNPKYVSERLGHSKLDFTLKLYTHITISMDEQAVEALNFSID